MAFNYFDRDENGAISASDLKQSIGNDKVGDLIWDQIISEVTQNKEISYSQFTSMMQPSGGGKAHHFSSHVTAKWGK